MKKIFTVFLLLFLTMSCTSTLDFDQANDLKLTPTAVFNLTYFEIPAPDFVTGEVENNLVFSVQKFDVFRDSFFRDNLVQADFFFEITNTINRRYRIDLVLADDIDQTTFFTTFNIPAGTTATPIVFTKDEIFKGATISQLKRSTQMGFRLRMLPGQALSENSSGSLKLRSSATLYMEIE